MSDRSEKVGEVIAALLKAHAAFTPLTKTREAEITMKSGGKYKYSYSNLNDVMEMVRPILVEHGLLLVHQIRDDDLITTLFHTSGEWLSTSYGLPKNAAPQQFGSALTYGRRYTTESILAVVAGDDDDGANAQRQHERSREDAREKREAAKIAASTEKQAAVAAGTKEMANAIETKLADLLEKAAENEISGAPQDEDTMRIALKQALADQMGAPSPNTTTVGKWIGMLSFAGLEDDGRVVFVVPEDVS